MDTFIQFQKKTKDVGIVEQVHHPLLQVRGLPNARLHEVVITETGEKGQVFLLQDDLVIILLFTKYPVTVGTKITLTDTFLSVPVGHELQGHIIDPLGSNKLNDTPLPKHLPLHEIDIQPLGIAKRARIKAPLTTGITVVDLVLPLGKGQKELVIGDRKTGRTSFLLTTVKQQVKEGAIAIYAAIGKRKTDIRSVYEFFEKEKILKDTIIVATTSDDASSLIYMTPFSAMTIAEYYRDHGQDVIVVFDDLSTHGYFYREMSLMARRFPGRDSYPGDIFYTHARLLERAGNFHHGNKEVAISAIPVVQIVEGDISSYVPTNIMSITDGHIFFDSNAYNQGRRPAINIGLSVTRVGKQTQTSLLRSISAELNVFFAQYDRRQNLSHFGTELTTEVQDTLAIGEMLYAFFNQPAGMAIPIPVQVVLLGMIWAKLIGVEEKDSLAAYREALIAAYEKKKTIFDAVMKKTSLQDMAAYVKKEEITFTNLCKIKKQS